ncbi:MAG: DUF1565 domain-containing protein [Rhodanobacteraceae bacterium]
MPRSVAILLAFATAAAHAADCASAPDTVFAGGFDPAAGSAFYVSPDGDDAGAGEIDSPWATIQHAADTIAPGDVACVRAGTYREVVTIARSGSAEAGRITFQAMPGESALIDGAGLDVPDGQYGLVTLLDASYVAIRGFEIANYETASANAVPIGIYVTGAGTGVRIESNHIHDIRTTADGCAANAFGLKVDGTRAPESINDLVIADNEIDHLVLGCSESFSLDGNVEHWTIERNHVHDTNNIGIGAIGFEGVAPDPAFDQARDGTIRDNVVHDITSFGNPAYGDEYAADGIYVDGGTRITIERNRIHRVDLGIELASEHAGRVTSDVIARNNLIYFGQSAGISIGGYDASVGGTQGCTIVGNTLLRNDRAGTGSGELQIQYHASGNRFANNIVYAGEAGLVLNAFTGDTDDPALLDYNLYDSDGGLAGTFWVWKGVEYKELASYRAASGQDAASIFADPRFVDPVAPDLHVDFLSPAIGNAFDFGADIVGATDFALDPRVVGAGIDIGAYEQ